MTEERILIVEDEGIAALDLQHRLTNLGYAVVDIVATGEEAVSKTEETCPDIVLMDIMLKGEIDGVTAAEQIHARLDIPIIFLTAYEDEEILRRAKQTEPYGYLVKPFKERDLHISIDMALYKHKTEKKLREREKWFATTLSSIGDALIATDKNGLITFMNPVAERLTGWKIKDTQNKKLTEIFNIINVHTRKPVENPVEKVIREGVTVSLVNHTILISREGTEIPINDSAAPIIDDRGNIIGIVLVFRDITEREKAEEVLKESEKHYRSLFENMKNGLAHCKMIFNNDGCPEDFVYLDVNSAFGRLTGLENVIGKKVTEVIPGIKELHPELFEIYGRVALTGQPEAFEIEFKPLAIWLSISVYSLEREYFTAVFDNITERKRATETLRESRAAALNLMRDAVASREETERSNEKLGKEIDERKKAEEALRESEQRLALAASATQIGMFDWDITNGRILWTQTHEAIFGYLPKTTTTTEYDYRKWADRVHPEDLPLVEEKSHLCVQNHEPLEVEYRIIWPDGSLHWVETRGICLNDSDGKANRMLGVVMDITCRKQSEENIKKLNEDLQRKVDDLAEANKELESFVYSISHDLRAPLRSIMGFSEFLLKQYLSQLDEKGKKYLDWVIGGAAKMNRIIDDLLHLSRITRHEIHRENIDISTIAAAAVKELCGTDSGCPVSIDIKEGIVANADPRLIEVALSNLLGNALKFTSKTAPPRIEFGAFEQEGKTVYYVKDNGAGFDQSCAERMFLPFHRLHSEQEFEGSGIGLAIVERVVHRHGGKIWAEGKVNEGATFFFTLN